MQLATCTSEEAFRQILAADPVATEKLERALQAAEGAQHALEARLRDKAAAWSIPLLPARPLVYAD